MAVRESKRMANLTATAAVIMLALILLIAIVPVQGAISYGRWRDINPTQYTADVAGTLLGVYMRSGGTGAVGAGDGWAVGGDTISGVASPIISHYDGFSWQINPSPTPAVWTSAHFCTGPGAPSVGLCIPNADGTDGWIVGGSSLDPLTQVPLALYWAGASSGFTPVNPPVLYTTGHGILNSVFMACHSPPFGSGCPSGGAFSPGLTIAVGSDGFNGVIYQFAGDPLHGGGWVFQTVTGATTSAYNSVYMYVDQTGNLAGFAVGNNGVVASYSGTWNAIQLPTSSNLLGVFVDQASPADAVAVGTGGEIWHYFSGIWHGPTTPKGTGVDLTGVFMTSTSEGWIVGTKSTILHTTNLSGNFWLPLGTPAQTATGTGVDLHSVSFPSSGNGWAVGSSGVILHTENSACGPIPSPCWGGSTSITQVASSGTGEQLNSVFMKASNDAWAGGLFDTTSGNNSLIHWDGNKWHRAVVAPMHGSPFDIWGIFMISSTEGWALGGNPNTPEALKWDSSSWTGQPITGCSYGPGPCEPRSVYMLSGGTGGDGWAVGTGGNIWRYQSGTWGLQSTPTTSNLNAVVINNWGSNTNAGWAVGDSGTVLKLGITGGVPTWSATGIPGITTTENLYGIFFTDSSHGWIVGAQSTIVSTSDGGVTWSGGGAPQVNSAPATTVLRSVYIDTFGVGSGNGDGWAVGDDGTSANPELANPVMAHWDGNSWTNMVPTGLAPGISPAGLGLRSVYLTTATDGFAVGGGVNAPVSLSGIFHLEPPASGGATTIATSSSGTQPITSTTPSLVTMSTVSSFVSTFVSTSVSLTSTTSTLLTTSSVAPTGIPGFPVESVIVGIVIGLATLFLVRRRRMHGRQS